MSATYVSGRPCPVCAHCEGYVVAHLDYALFDDLAISGHKTLVQCDLCGMLYDDVAFSANQLHEYYRRNAHYAVSAIGGSGSTCVDNNARYDRIIDLLQPIPKGVIVDFGCGQGGLLSRCRERGLTAIGIESSLESASIAQQMGLLVYASFAAFVTTHPSCHIHAVVFSHVLEHLMFPLHHLRLAAQYAHDALVYIEVPDADSYLLSHAVCWPEMHFEHLSHFRQHHLEELAQHAGLDIRQYGKTFFSELSNRTHCQYIIGRFAAETAPTIEPTSSRSASAACRHHSRVRIPFVSLDTVPTDDRPLALWGISQYAMLLLGSCQKLSRRIRHLFDGSPAKIGRSIRGLVVESSDNLPALTAKHILLIPTSLHLLQMRTQLSHIHFQGQVIEV